METHQECRRRYLNFVYIVIVNMGLLLFSYSDALKLDADCYMSLGMESGIIPDSAISASSSYDSASVGPHRARLQSNKQGGAWCPRHMVSRESKEYLEIDLGDMYVVTGVKTQGRFGNGQGQEYAEQYMIEYWRDGLNKWVKWNNRTGSELLAGNTDTYTIVEQILDPPIISSKIRLLPYSDHVRTVCMRIEILGCLWIDGLLSYSMPQGIQRGNDLDLRDRIYDGSKDQGQLEHGLGQLTDGQIGKDNFRLDINGLGKGYEWIGWRNDTPGWSGLPLEILFVFDRVRNFSAAHLYTNNMFSKDVQVFSHAKAFFSLNGYKFSAEPVHFSYMPDTVMEHSRNVTIKLHQKIGKFLKLQLYFASKWILLSEVSFDSLVVNGNFTQQETTEEQQQQIVGVTFSPSFVSREYPIQRDEVVKFNFEKGTPARSATAIDSSSSLNGASASNRHQPSLIGSNGSSGSNRSNSNSGGYISIVIGFLTVIILCLASAIAIIILRNQRFKPVVNMEDTANEKIPAAEEQQNNHDDVVIDCKNLNEQQQNNYSDVPDLVSRGFEPSQMMRPPPVPPPPKNYFFNDDNCMHLSPTFRKRPLTRRHLMLPLSPHKIDAAIENDEDEQQHQQQLGSEVVYNDDGDDDDDADDVDHGNHDDNTQVVTINTIDNEHLRIMESIGHSGKFSDVYLCELIRNCENCEEKGDSNGSSDVNNKLCVVYRLANEEMFIEFKRDTTILARLNHINVATVLGGSLNNAPFYLVREYGCAGDLYQFLQDHVAESTAALSTNATTLSYGCLIYISTQVAAGMKYMESQKFVHKDLAARNCLVGKNYQIKISDLGFYREIYSQDYCRLPGSDPIPLRWIAWESALLGKFSSKSDVWSFAILLWEILTFAREQPFELLSDEKILENLAHYYENNNKQIYLNVPYNCPREIYDLMCECWNRNESDRPTFKEIHLFLQRKNLGYQPDMH